ncbi:methylated-DNA--[protein]-cysteine S-methyltransferase [Aromatoleum toluclasticum]|uniref:methylated-DNA--[protein]-cysteine S-methyltransferase n=1 Tax=Aromatoleum toluclasticum TaxID=92003 RepID=UPI001D18310F|nr:methylated-DNA--[protein]-cysteine S-methyltransferase [Aromatoleum toluclasticum]MCC4116934.1 methylated-DNA--[protein]-cysteine S-methyltransferase [Aromatoleum toluclasticum]
MSSDRPAPAGATFSAILTLPFGGLGVYADRRCILELVFLPPGTRALAPDTPLAERAATQLLAWLDDPDRPFDLPLAERGTPFQRRVWTAISAIPRGTHRTYGEIAGGMNSAARAVGQACGANPFPIVVPCHRVVAAGGGLGGFANSTGGYLLDTKRWLLQFEAGR